MDEIELEKNCRTCGPQNHYGSLCVSFDASGYYWSVENYDGFNWYKISKDLYEHIVKEHPAALRFDPTEE